MEKYRKEGFADGSVSAIITMIVGVGVAVLVLIFVGSLGGQTYNLVESDIETIGVVYMANGSINTTASNYTIQNSIKGGVISGFEALEQTGDYLPIIVLAVVITIVLGLVLTMGGLTGGYRGGSAL
jgi:hypothetical protein